MKIAIVVSSLRKAGPIIVVQNLIRNFNRKDHEIVIIKLLQDEPSRSITHEFIADGIKVYELNCCKFGIELFTFHERRRFKKLIDEIKPDIIHTHGYQPVLLASAIKHIPVVETLHCVAKEDFIMTHGKTVGIYMLYRYYSSMKKITGAAAITDNVKYKNELQLPLLPIRRIYNGVKLPQCNKSRESIRVQLHLENDTIMFVVIGALRKLKDPITIIRAFKKTFPIQSYKPTLWFIGKGVLYEECKKEIGDDDRIKLVGWQPNVYDYLEAADYSIAASHSEGFGLNFVESVAAGVPVIGTNIPPFREFTYYFSELRNFEFKPGNTDELANKLELAAKSSIDMSQYQERTRCLFSAQTMAKEYEKFYIDMIKLSAQ